jgi:hypothetical protein
MLQTLILLSALIPGHYNAKHNYNGHQIDASLIITHSSAYYYQKSPSRDTLITGPYAITQPENLLCIKDKHYYCSPIISHDSSHITLDYNTFSIRFNRVP